MKINKSYVVNRLSQITLIIILISINFTHSKGGLKDYKPAPESKIGDLSNIDVDNLSEKELDALLKDPKLSTSSISSSIKINPKAELKKVTSKKSKYAATYKEHLDNLNKEGLNVEDVLPLDGENDSESSI